MIINYYLLFLLLFSYTVSILLCACVCVWCSNARGYIQNKNKNKRCRVIGKFRGFPPDDPEVFSIPGAAFSPMPEPKKK